VNEVLAVELVEEGGDLGGGRVMGRGRWNGVTRDVER
jgi:hypothetical protein